MRTTGYSVAKSKILFIRFSYLFGSVLTVLLKIRYLKLFNGIFVYYSLLKFRLNTIFCQFLKARVFFLVRLPPLAVLDCACFQNQHIPFLNSSVHRTASNLGLLLQKEQSVKRGEGPSGKQAVGKTMEHGKLC